VGDESVDVDLGWAVCRGALKVGQLKAEGTKAVAPSFTRAASSTLGLSPAWHLDFGKQMKGRTVRPKQVAAALVTHEALSHTLLGIFHAPFA